MRPLNDLAPTLSEQDQAIIAGFEAAFRELEAAAAHLAKALELSREAGSKMLTRLDAELSSH